ncbi:hypothetical protein C3F09_07480 [candidate division GN15 bacterium]|uniref:Uncharacterized protein n=1 Tax=candidate division GN15 bacterium TaxID=2072418 RepID=A0A855X642_9BACT|nr:MAG: hypothetical protein C3F09_07480 [candidate division GN15 bacterium]
MFGDIHPPDSMWRRARARMTLILLPVTAYLLFRHSLWESRSIAPFCNSRTAADVIAYAWIIILGPIILSLVLEEAIRRKVAAREGIELSLFYPLFPWSAGIRVKTYLAIGVVLVIGLELTHQLFVS